MAGFSGTFDYLLWKFSCGAHALGETKRSNWYRRNRDSRFKRKARHAGSEYRRRYGCDPGSWSPGLDERRATHTSSGEYSGSAAHFQQYHFNRRARAHLVQRTYIFRYQAGNLELCGLEQRRLELSDHLSFRETSLFVSGAENYPYKHSAPELFKVVSRDFHQPEMRHNRPLLTRMSL